MRFLGPCALFTLPFFVGCDSGPALTPVSGIVTFDGKPFAGALVKFIPQGDTQGHGGACRTGTDGQYIIAANRLYRPGLLPGEYKVTVSRLLLPNGDPLPPNVGPADSPHVESVPEPFCKAKLTPLAVTVGANAVTFDIPLEK